MAAHPPRRPADGTGHLPAVLHAFHIGAGAGGGERAGAGLAGEEQLVVDGPTQGPALTGVASPPTTPCREIVDMAIGSLTIVGYIYGPGAAGETPCPPVRNRSVKL